VHVKKCGLAFTTLEAVGMFVNVHIGVRRVDKRLRENPDCITASSLIVHTVHSMQHSSFCNKYCSQSIIPLNHKDELGTRSLHRYQQVHVHME
jgi:hypothetical protein